VNKNYVSDENLFSRSYSKIALRINYSFGAFHYFDYPAHEPFVVTDAIQSRGEGVKGFTAPSFFSNQNYCAKITREVQDRNSCEALLLTRLLFKRGFPTVSRIKRKEMEIKKKKRSR
jgi:hypothetical protein